MQSCAEAQSMARSDRAQVQQHEHSLKPLVKPQASGFSPPMMSKAQVVYYLCRGGKMEPPHMIEVPHSPHDGLRLRDVKHRLTILRGSGMPNMFSWSCKRMYKNTHIWQDVCDDDSLSQVAGGEYILKGSEYIESGQEIQQKPQVSKASQSQNQDAAQLQRKFRGAETWLKVPASAPLSPRLHNSSQLPETTAAAAAAAVTGHLRSLSLLESNHSNPKTLRPTPEVILSGSSSDESTSTTTKNKFPAEDPHDIKVMCDHQVRSHGPSPVDHSCSSVGTQTDEHSYLCGGTPGYKSSGSSTPACLMAANESDQRKQELHQPTAHGKLKRKFGKHQAAPGKETPSPKVKMKHSGASCVFLHILSYCGGVDTKMQRRRHRSPPTEITSSEYSFDGVCRGQAESLGKAHQGSSRSPGTDSYSMELVHHHQSACNMDSNGYNRSGPLIPYSSEYFDVKEAVSPLPSSSPLGKSSKPISSNMTGAEDEELELPPRSSSSSSDESSRARDDPDPHPDEDDHHHPENGNKNKNKSKQDDEQLEQDESFPGNCRTTGGPGAGASVRSYSSEWRWSSCPGQTREEDERPLKPWNRNLRLSKRRFYRHWWQALFDGFQAKLLLSSALPKNRHEEHQHQKLQKQTSVKRLLFVNKCRRSRGRSPGF